MRDFRDLKVWEKAHGLVLDVYRHSRDFPSEERFGLISHLRKSVVSIPSNIAEGCGRDSEKDLSRFLSYAAGSASETEYQILLAHDLGYLSKERYDHVKSLIIEVKRMLYALKESLSSEVGRGKG